MLKNKKFGNQDLATPKSKENSNTEQAGDLETLMGTFRDTSSTTECHDEQSFNQQSNELGLQVVEKIENLIEHLTDIKKDILKLIQLHDARISENQLDLTQKSQVEIRTSNTTRIRSDRKKSTEKVVNNSSSKDSSESLDDKSLTRMNNLEAEWVKVQETPSSILSTLHDFMSRVEFLSNVRLASCTGQSITVWNIQDGKKLYELEGHTDAVYSLATLPNGLLASGSVDGTIKVWDLEQRKEIISLNGHEKAVLALRVLKNGNLVSYSKDDTIKLWDLFSAEQKLLSSMSGHGNVDWFLPLFDKTSTDLLISCSVDKANHDICQLRVWNCSQAKLVRSISTGLKAVRALLVISNDQVALGFKNGTIKIVDLENERATRTRKGAYDCWILDLGLLSVGFLISIGGDIESENIKVWSLSDLVLKQSIDIGYLITFFSLSVSPNEKVLATTSNDGKIKLWPIISDV